MKIKLLRTLIIIWKNKRTENIVPFLKQNKMSEKKDQKLKYSELKWEVKLKVGTRN